MNFKSIMALRDLVKPAYLQRAARTTTGLVGGTVLGAGINSGYPMGTGEDLPVPLRFAAGWHGRRFSSAATLPGAAG